MKISTNGNLSLSSEKGLKTIGATFTRVAKGWFHVLEVTDADIEGSKVKGGTVKLNGTVVQPDAQGVVDLSKLKSPLGKLLTPGNRRF